jgi:hypothetical protein
VRIIDFVDAGHPASLYSTASLAGATLMDETADDHARETVLL